MKNCKISMIVRSFKQTPLAKMVLNSAKNKLDEEFVIVVFCKKTTKDHEPASR